MAKKDELIPEPPIEANPKKDEPVNIMEKPVSDAPPKSKGEKEFSNNLDLSPIINELQLLRKDLDKVVNPKAPKSDPALEIVKIEPKEDNYKIGDEFDLEF